MVEGGGKRQWRGVVMRWTDGVGEGVAVGGEVGVYVGWDVGAGEFWGGVSKGKLVGWRELQGGVRGGGSWRLGSGWVGALGTSVWARWSEEGWKGPWEV